MSPPRVEAKAALDRLKKIRQTQLMQLNLIHPETWSHLNQQIHELLELPAEVSVRVYQGLPHAAYEVALGTALFLSHKKSVGWLQGQTPAFQAVLPILYKEAFQVQCLSLKAPATPYVAWIKSLKADTSFVMLTEDNPVTGELFEISEAEALLHDKKIFSMRVSHRQHFWHTEFRSRNILPSTVQICELSPTLAIAICGSRFKSPVQISSYLKWDSEAVLREIENFKAVQNDIGQHSTQIQDSVAAFENKCPEGFVKFSASIPCRIMDRSLIYHPEIQGEALETELRLRLQLPRESSAVRSLSQCGREFIDWSWWEHRPADDIMRDLVILDQSILSEANLWKILAESIQACRI